MKTWRALLTLTILTLCGTAHALSVATEILVSIPDQDLALIDCDKLIAHYPISTSKFGIGDANENYRTPRGTLFVSGKFGDRLAPGSVIKCKVATGEIVDDNAPGRDAIWLRGMEGQNRAAHGAAFIFTERRKNGASEDRPASVASACAQRM